METDFNQTRIPEDLWAFRTERRDDLLAKLRSDRRWFVVRRSLLQAAWFGLSILSLLLGVLTSVLIAIGWPSTENAWDQAILILLPAISGLCGAFIGNYRLRETWELREFGRIETDRLIVEAKFIDRRNPDFDSRINELHMRRVQLARRQASQFFAFFARVAANGEPAESS
ncbi:hypothetical protein [Ancylobacter mangrovi]|uniref:hypothetical protein n=1 Tax=Ancylobacter mangrovi TaxID=2972472 RepID=UPI002162C46A|nr:hypothetical protein [Ancylobacter mangrovi]MCS0503125.1 hypothetical protein [Ancylobacter mangrovi]